MMIGANTTHEAAVTLSGAAELLPYRVSVETLRRWIRSGVRGVRLTATYSGGKWWTTRADLDQFTAEVTRRRIGAASVAPARSSRVARSYLRERYGI